MLQVPSSQPTMDMPEMGNDPTMMGGDPSMMNADPSMGGEMQPNMMGDTGETGMGDEKNYDADFDAGVEANESEDPKKFNQQLAGKMSQSLQAYEDSLPQPDSETAKYVGGMVLSQLVKYLTPDDFNEMVKNAQEKGEEGETEPVETEAEPTEGGEEMGPTQSGEVDNGELEQPMQESLKRHINELFQNIKMDNEDEDDNKKDINPKEAGKLGYKRKGYLPKTFK